MFEMRRDHNRVNIALAWLFMQHHGLLVDDRDDLNIKIIHKGRKAATLSIEHVVWLMIIAIIISACVIMFYTLLELNLSRGVHH